MKTILITGGAGFIGSATVRRFLEEGIGVVVYDDFSYGRREFLPDDDRLEIVVGDINDTDRLAETLARVTPDYLCHLAAIHFIPDCNADPPRALQVNTVGTESVLNAAAGTRIDKVLIASTAAVYPINDDPNAEEGTPAAPIDIYGLSKLFSEALAEKYVRETGGTAVAVRLFNAVGPRETNPHVIPHIFESAGRGDTIPLGNVEPKRDYIHTADMAEAMLAICRSGMSGFETVNVGTGEEYSVAELVEMIGGIIGRKLTIEQKADRVRSVERMHLVADISRIGTLTGWRPKMSIADSLADTAKYYGLV